MKKKISFCLNCGKEIFDYISRNKRYCSVECVRLNRKPCSQETKRKISEAQKGKSGSPETKFKIGHKFIVGGEKGWFNKGQKPSNWQGGIRTLSQIIKDDIRWKKWRKQVFERDNYTCQDCGDRNGNGKRVYLEPHHIKAVSKYPELSYELKNGITLCKKCHTKTDNYGGKKK